MGEAAMGGSGQEVSSSRGGRQPHAAPDEVEEPEAPSDPMDQRKLKERQEVEATNPSNCPGKGEMWFLIDASWLRLWRKFTKPGSKDKPPGPITNHRLLLKDGRPAPGLHPETHYCGINGSTWNYLFNVYGGGPEIKSP